jgi:small subunit ribosomal protein S16
MALRIRMMRTGRKNEPHFRIGVFEQRSRRDGRCIERLGHFDPRTRDPGRRLALDRERVQHWLKVGATPSLKLARILKTLKIAR